ncbi:hypothetical protein BVG19_g1324 [[Candida] boidinii]|nr:hypothetical protein BVG19_g1324 [[Candida] boidinii]OWB49051.1 hypothetical protein B5S27_g590 [[Candida] boidinii]
MMMIQATYPSLINSNNFLSLPQHIGTIKTKKIWISNKKETVNTNTDPNANANTISNDKGDNDNDDIVHISYDITNPTVSELYKLMNQLNILISEITKTENINSSNSANKLEIESMYKLNLLIATYCKNLLLSSNPNSSITSLSHVLKIWEIRLNCMLLLSSKPITTLLSQSDTNSGLVNPEVATRFPISSAGQQQQQQQQQRQPAFASMNTFPDQNHIIISSAKMLKTEVNILLKELDAIYKTRSEKQQQQLQQQASQQTTYTSVAPKYPDELEWDFKLLLNRIRHGSSLILVNYYFLEVFDLRSNIGILQSSINTAGSIGNDIENRIKYENDKLTNLIYSVLSVMISKQEFLTSFNLLIEIIEKDETSENNSSESNKTKKLNKLNKFKILMLLILIGLIMIIKEIGVDKIENINENAYFPIINKYFTEFTKKESESADDSTNRELVIEMLIQVLSKIEPIYNDLNTKPIDETRLKDLKENFNLNNLIKSCSEFKISGRILCCLCGKFEINNKLNNIEVDIKECEDYNECLTVLNKEWDYNINNYYAIE